MDLRVYDPEQVKIYVFWGDMGGVLNPEDYQWPRSEYGLDIETTGLSYPDDDLVSVQLYRKRLEALDSGVKDEIYVLDPGNAKRLMDYPPFRDSVESTALFNGAYDLPFLFRDEIVPSRKNLKDGSIAAIKLQLSETNLKYLAMSLGFWDLESLTYETLVMQFKSSLGMNPLEPVKVTFRDMLERAYVPAIEYAAKDPFAHYWVAEELYRKYEGLIGSPERAREILDNEVKASWFLRNLKI